MSVEVVRTKAKGGTVGFAVMIDTEAQSAFGPAIPESPTWPDPVTYLLAFVGWAGITSERSQAEVWGLFEDFQRLAMKCSKCGEWGAGTFCHECGDALTPESRGAAEQESVPRG